MTKLKPLIVGNWKMNGLRSDGVALATAIAEKMAATGKLPFDMLICPPFTLIAEIIGAVEGSGLLVGAQNCHAELKGAHTGDISAAMLKDLGCSHVIVGHSERRRDHQETSEMVHAKAKTAHTTDLTVIICIGETKAERDQEKTIEVVSQQLKESLPETATPQNTIIAYEPVWAIGTGHTPTLEDVEIVHNHILKETSLRILYGGSVNPSNAKDLLAIENVHGALVGGASLNTDDFWTIAENST